MFTQRKVVVRKQEQVSIEALYHLLETLNITKTLACELMVLSRTGLHKAENRGSLALSNYTNLKSGLIAQVAKDALAKIQLINSL